jgi:hypothetical protein
LKPKIPNDANANTITVAKTNKSKAIGEGALRARANGMVAIGPTKKTNHNTTN